MTITETRTPWIANLGDVPATLDYFQGSMYEAVEKIAEKYPDYIAYDFMGQHHLQKVCGADKPVRPCPEGHRHP